MTEDDVRASAELVGAALVAGDVDTAIGYMSEELKRNLGEVVALLPLPALEATIESVERGASAFVVVVRVVGESTETELETRWKDRDGEPRIVEVSHRSQVATEVADDTDADAGDEGTAPAATA
ncbi:MAG: hypothetical protein ABI620_06495 [Chloroflexota bacterium]